MMVLSDLKIQLLGDSKNKEQKTKQRAIFFHISYFDSVCIHHEKKDPRTVNALNTLQEVVFLCCRFFNRNGICGNSMLSIILNYDSLCSWLCAAFNVHFLCRTIRDSFCSFPFQVDETNRSVSCSDHSPQGLTQHSHFEAIL